MTDTCALCNEPIAIVSGSFAAPIYEGKLLSPEQAYMMGEDLINSPVHEQCLEIAKLEGELKRTYELINYWSAEASREHQVACDLFVVIADIAKLVGFDDSDPEICRKTVTAVKRLVLAYEWLQRFHKVHRKAMAWFGRVPNQESEKEVDHYSKAFEEETAVSANVRAFLEETVTK